MSFLNDVDTIKAKLHLSHIPLPLRVGLVVLCVAILFILFQGLWELGSNAHLLDNSSQSPSQETEGIEITNEENSEEGSNEQVQAELISVHIVGCVVSPGLYEVESGSRIKEVVDAAGGFTEEASQGSVNLARIVEDGEQVVVASKNANQQTSSTTSSSSSNTQTSNATSGGLVNINTADATTLCTLSGIGEATANKIIADREKNGPFKTKKDITRVSGIGDKKYEAIKDSITV